MYEQSLEQNMPKHSGKPLPPKHLHLSLGEEKLKSERNIPANDKIRPRVLCCSAFTTKLQPFNRSSYPKLRENF